MSLKGLLFVMLGMALAFASYFYWDYKKTGGYQKNSDGYYGYFFPRDNGLNNPADCELANTENPKEPPVSAEWMQGCKKYFEINQ
ncbi:MULTISPECIES: hypothetical protein [Acinetobacter]|uniref:hypothetical protein n=1 Tax=Acinetobacter TaxID=469 RepID=UPI0002CF8513|nr:MULTISPECIES: hypothetical protein [Acinetobacter]ENX57097.1 hypothetical protein F885_03253 [Acinetobacter higginsii]MCH7297067.1 hypothetical protein [Acinetobacter higginsii]MCH7306158.1 hypothetical protein [Acinetobacter higginsii]MCH7318059.1 hypothetical protein [Acinetobacter higginsii]MCH7378830.1 hypothetical protein [Acinetobacter higginsii]